MLSTQAKNQISNTKKNKDKKTKPESKFIRGKGGRLLRRGSPTAMRAENRERARKRAQEMARKRLRNKLMQQLAKHFAKGQRAKAKAEAKSIVPEPEIVPINIA